MNIKLIQLMISWNPIKYKSEIQFCMHFCMNQWDKLSPNLNLIYSYMNMEI